MYSKFFGCGETGSGGHEKRMGNQEGKQSAGSPAHKPGQDCPNEYPSACLTGIGECGEGENKPGNSIIGRLDESQPTEA
jgi:hypothetical protein